MSTSRPEGGMSRTVRILLVDDDPTFRELAGRILAGRYHVECCETPENALELLEHRDFDVVLADLYFDELDTALSGFDLIERLHERYPDLPVLVLSRASDPRDISRSLSLGAFHFVSKSFELGEIANLIGRAVESKHMESQLRLQHLLDALKAGELVYRCEKMQEVIARAKALARLSEPILLTGESGTGKDLLASFIHESSRPNRPFIPVNVSARSASLFEDELFGHDAGAFTDARQTRRGILEIADGGTVFLDEIAALGIDRQAALLRLIEDRSVRRLGSEIERQVDVRFVLATNEDLAFLESQSRFRADLLYRINPHRVHLPPLRERGGDVVFIAEEYLRSRPRPRHSLDTQAREFLQSYHWPGNVRQLLGILRSACATQAPGVLHRDHLEAELEIQAGPSWPGTVRGAAGDTEPPRQIGVPADEHRFLGHPIRSLLPYHVGKSETEWTFRQTCIEYAQASAPQNVSRQAEIIGVSRETYYKWLRELGYESSPHSEAETDRGS
jgi:DNA-binding NtrC family response regulator